MPILRQHVHNYITMCNHHSIRPQKNRLYLINGKSYLLYQGQLPTSTSCTIPQPQTDLGYTPDPLPLTELLSMLQDYDLDAYFTTDSHSVCVHLLQDHGWPIEYQYQDLHRDAYLFLHTQLWDHILHQSLPYIHLLNTPVGNLHCSQVQAEFMNEISHESAEYSTDNDTI